MDAEAAYSVLFLVAALIGLSPLGRSRSGVGSMRKIPKIIPPRSRVRLTRADDRTPNWKKDIGRHFRVGYYSPKDGLDCIWLVNEEGEYEQTTDRKFLLKYFRC